MLAIDTLVGLVAPHACITCRKEGSVMCGQCVAVAGDPQVPRCAGCKKLSENWKTCRSCKSWLPLETIRIAVPYEGIYEQLLHDYKFAYKRQAAHPIAALMTQVMDGLAEDVVVMHLPTAPSRIRQRGFDHGKILASLIARATNRKRATYLHRFSNSRQVGATRAKRIEQMSNAYFLDNPKAITGKTFLLTDDVMTTGASLAAAAKVLKQAGAKGVHAVIFAQKIQ